MLRMSYLIIILFKQLRSLMDEFVVHTLDRDKKKKERERAHREKEREKLSCENEDTSHHSCMISIQIS